MFKPYFSASQLSMLSRCQKQYELSYVRKIKTPASASMVRGTGAHAGIEMDLREKMATGNLLDVEHLKELTADVTRAKWADEQPQLTDDELIRGEADVRGETIDNAVACAVAYHQHIAPHVVPVAIEQAAIIELPGFPRDLKVVKDIETATHIRDTKTSGKSKTQDEADSSVQLTLYHLESAVRGEAKGVTLDTLVIGKSGVKAQVLESKRDTQDHAQLLRRVEVAAKVVESGVFAPADPGSWCCSPKWCGHWTRCEFGARGQVSVGLIDPKRLTSRPAARRGA